MDRREFLKFGAGATAAVALPSLIVAKDDPDSFRVYFRKVWHRMHGSVPYIAEPPKNWEAACDWIESFVKEGFEYPIFHGETIEWGKTTFVFAAAGWLAKQGKKVAVASQNAVESEKVFGKYTKVDADFDCRNIHDAWTGRKYDFILIDSNCTSPGTMANLPPYLFHRGPVIII